ncbi:MAG TPA: DUF2255 family protein [Pengzhenrongella sp.]
MSTWTPQAARAVTAPQEVQVVIRRPDGAIATGTGQLVARGTTYEVVFTEAQGSDLARVDAAYRRKHGAYASIVDHLEEDGPRAATLEVHPV